MRDFRIFHKPNYGVSRALIIGIDRYKSAPALGYAVSDATAINNLLISEFNFLESDITLLTDANATRQTIASAFLRFANDDIKLDDRIIVFFAGHGHTRTGSRGEIGFLVPYDADIADFSTFIRWNELTDNADLILAKHILFIMDACYGGLALTRSAGPGSTRFLKDMMRRTSRQVLTAGKADETVSDSGGPIPNHSVFTGHLIEALQGKATTSDGVLTASAVMAYVYNKVANDKSSRQTPHYGHIDGDGDMVLHAPEFDAIGGYANSNDDRLVSVPFFEHTSEYNSTHSKIKRVKALLASDSGVIELHDMLSSEVKHFLTLTGEDTFAPTEQYAISKLEPRLARYEAATLDLGILLACVAHWGRSRHLATLQKCIARSSDRIESKSGSTVWLALRWYPLLLQLYCSGIAAIDASRFDALNAIFRTTLPSSVHQPTSITFLTAASAAVLELNRNDVFRFTVGNEKKTAPVSEYLLRILQPVLDDALFLGKNYEEAFDNFEVYFALCVMDAELVRGEKIPWAPIGRFRRGSMYVNSPLANVLKEASEQQHEWLPIKAGLFGGNLMRFRSAEQSLSSFMSGR